MRIYLTRHGETETNREKRLQGRSDIPLNDNGILQSEQVRDFFQEQGIHFDRVYSSPLKRAYNTARIIVGEDADIITDERILEIDYGPYEGKSLVSPPPEIIRFFSDFANNPAPEGMEALDHIIERFGDFLEDIKSDEDIDVLIATHAIAMKGGLEYLSPEHDGSYWSKYIGNCSVYMAETKEGSYTPPREIFSLSYEPGV